MSRDKWGSAPPTTPDWYLHGDLKKAELIMEDGARVAFDRTSQGSSHFNAMLRHTSTPTEFYGARLGWTGQNWAIRFANGELRTIQAGGQRIVFEYDDRNRIVRAAHRSQEAAYSYDDRGRLIRSIVNGVRSFDYGSRDEMIKVDDPDQSVEVRREHLRRRPAGHTAGCSPAGTRRVHIFIRIYRA